MTGAQNRSAGTHQSLAFRNAIPIRIITPTIAKLMTKDSTP